MGRSRVVQHQLDLLLGIDVKPACKNTKYRPRCTFQTELADSRKFHRRYQFLTTNQYKPVATSENCSASCPCRAPPMPTDHRRWIPATPFPLGSACPSS